MKKITSIFLCTIFALSLASCGEKTVNKPIRSINMGYDLFELPKKDDSRAIENGNIKVGIKYVLYFSADFSNVYSYLKKDEVVSIIMTVNLGPLDDEEENSMNGRNKPDGGFGYASTGTGQWSARFILNSDLTPPNFEKTPFNIWTDTIGNDSNQAITVRMESPDLELFLGPSDNYSVSFNISKGDFNFSKNDNLIQRPNYTVSLAFPLLSSKVNITYYSDDTKLTTLGTFSYEHINDTINFDFADHIAQMFYEVKEPSEEQLLNIRSKIVAGDYENYLVSIEAEGGKNYNNVSFDYHPFIKEGV